MGEHDEVVEVGEGWGLKEERRDDPFGSIMRGPVIIGSALEATIRRTVMNNDARGRRLECTTRRSHVLEITV
jgi:hypothetical protein